MANYNLNSPYNVIVIRLDPSSDAILNYRNAIIKDINDNCNDSDKFMINWFSEPKWTKNQFTYCNVVLDETKNLVSIAGSKVLPDNSMKVLCHFYVIKKLRHLYRSLQQTDLIPSDVEYAKEHNLDGIWYSVHAFDKRHDRLIRSTLRKMNGGGLDISAIPYWSKIEHHGKVVYNYTEQDKFYLNIKDLK